MQHTKLPEFHLHASADLEKTKTFLTIILRHTESLSCEKDNCFKLVHMCKI